MKAPPGPIIIGATGGSGTRVVAEVLKSAGVHMGHDLNRANDTRSTREFRKSWARRYLAADYGRRLSLAELDAMHQSLRDALDLQQSGASNHHIAWGWKNPPNVLLLQCYFEWLPECRFVHLIRDGRDMAFSDNRGQLNKFGDCILTQGERQLPEWQQKLLFWARTNLRATEVGETAGAERYCLLRFEDLTDDPLDTLTRLASFTGLPDSLAQTGQNLVRTPASIGRWREHADALGAFESPEVSKALSRFGYG